MSIKTLTTKLTLLFLSLSLPMISNEIDVTQDLRILELLPRDQVVSPLAIQPAIPDNFVALDQNGKQNVHQFYFWGPEETLKTFFKELKAPKEPIFSVMVTNGMVQKAPGEINIEEIQAVFKDCPFCYKVGKWGEYPYALVTGELEDEKINMAFVGSNQDGLVYTFRLVYPEDKKLESAAVALWDKFINETKQLPEPLFFKCMGQEMHVGHTICDAAGRKLLFQAELNEKENLLQISVEPQEGNIDFQFTKADLCKMGTKWHFNDDLVKIDGLINVENGWVNVNQTTSVLLKKTKTFSKPSKKTGFHKIFKVGEMGQLTVFQPNSSSKST